MKHSKSSLFLMELIIALLFFSLASTVCIRLFVKAHSLSSQTVDMNHAVNYAQNMAETFVGCEGDLQAMQTILSGSELALPDGDILVLVLNEYLISLRRSGSISPGDMVSADINVYLADDDEVPPVISTVSYRTEDVTSKPLYTLHVDLHIPYVK